jgi:2-isopropylmalate synthase
MKRVISIYDTTLRDGNQAEDFNLSLEDKLKICLKLDRLGVDYIEGGWPGSNPKDVDFFNQIKTKTLQHSCVAAFGSTRNFNKPPEMDPNLNALLQAQTEAITIFGKTWDVHVRDALRIGLEDNLTLIEDSLAYLRPHVKNLFYDAEHFFDGFKQNRPYALATLERAISGGAECLVLCDTNGGTLPNELADIIDEIKKLLKRKKFKGTFGIHAHNDTECAVANSLLAIEYGASQVQGTMNGVGERCGNANLTSIMPALLLKMKNYAFSAAENMQRLSETSRFISEIANLPHNKYQPYVGAAAFAHKGGVHVSAVQRNPLTYEHIDPEKVGNARRVLISDQSGKSNVLYKAGKFGLQLDSKSPILSTILKRLKDLENKGFQYEGAEASFELMMRRAMGVQRQYFVLLSFRVIDQKCTMENPMQAEATIRLEVGGEVVHTAALGEGPVNALDNALRKALTRFYPQLADMWLDDYKVRVLASEHGTGAGVRVLIESCDHASRWSTVGVSHDILEASWQALVDSITYKLMKDEKNKQAPAT